MLLLASFPELRLCTLLLDSSNIVQQSRFLRVQVGRFAGLKAAKCGLLCGRTPGIGESTASDPLSRYAGWSVRS